MTSNIDLQLIAAAQAQKHVTANENFSKLDTLVQPNVIDKDLSTPPASPTTGDTYIVAGSATGAWAGRENAVVSWSGTAWDILTPKDGWFLFVKDEDLIYWFNGTVWAEYSAGGGGGVTIAQLQDGSLEHLGINRLSSVGVRLSVSSATVMFNRETDNVNIVLNKEETTDTAFHTIQTGLSTRAFYGVNSSDDFQLSVSPDGSAFHQALSVDKDTGNVGLAGATADANNALIIGGANVLHANSAGSVSYNFSKNVVGSNAAMSFQNNFSTRAQFGLLGNDDFTIRVSPDGSNFNDAIVVNRTTGEVTFPNTTIGGGGGGANEKMLQFGGNLRLNASNAWVGFGRTFAAGALGSSAVLNYGTGSEPTINYEALGDMFVPNGTIIKSFGIAWRIDKPNHGVTSFNWKLYFQYNSWDGTADASGDITRVEIGGGTWNVVDNTLSALQRHIEDITDYTTPSDGSILLIVKSNGTISGTTELEHTGYVLVE